MPVEVSMSHKKKHYHLSGVFFEVSICSLKKGFNDVKSAKALLSALGLIGLEDDRMTRVTKRDRSSSHLNRKKSESN